MADRAKEQSEVLSDLFQELGWKTKLHKQNLPPHGWIVSIRSSGHAPPPHDTEANQNVGAIIVDDGGNIMVDWDEPKGFIEKTLTKYGLGKYIANDAPKFKTLEILGRRWFQRTYGNTYHTAEIFIDGKLVHKTPKAYGYGDGYVQSAQEWLVKKGYLSPIWAGKPLWKIRDEYGIEIRVAAEDVERQRDL